MAQNPIKLVGYLQVADKPIASLYCNLSEKTVFVRLFLLVNQIYDVIVTPSEVLSYMDGLCSLKQLTKNQTLKNDGMFIEELCNERNRIEYFLTHINEFFTAGVTSAPKYKINGKCKNSTNKRADNKA